MAVKKIEVIEPNEVLDRRQLLFDKHDILKIYPEYNIANNQSNYHMYKLDENDNTWSEIKHPLAR